MVGIRFIFAFSTTCIESGFVDPVSKIGTTLVIGPLVPLIPRRQWIFTGSVCLTRTVFNLADIDDQKTFAQFNALRNLVLHPRASCCVSPHKHDRDGTAGKLSVNPALDRSIALALDGLPLSFVVERCLVEVADNGAISYLRNPQEHPANDAHRLAPPRPAHTPIDLGVATFAGIHHITVGPLQIITPSRLPQKRLQSRRYRQRRGRRRRRREASRWSFRFPQGIRWNVLCLGSLSSAPRCMRRPDRTTRRSPAVRDFAAPS